MGGIFSKKIYIVLLIVSVVVILSVAVFLLVYWPASPTVEQNLVVANPPVDLANVPEKALPFPEIPVNEYWAFGKIGEQSIYVNNTDRGVIYSLDKNGKILWSILGADYGFPGTGKIGYGSYEIRLVSDHLFITRNNTDELGNDWATLWVFDGQGRLKWTNNFYGYLDMPLMRMTSQHYVILQNRSYSVLSEVGCGVYCSTKAKQKLNESAMWAFDLETGRVIWKNTSRVGGSLSYDEQSKVLRIDGSCDKSSYTISAETGEIMNYQMSILCFRDKDNFERLVYAPGRKEVQVQKSEGAMWTLVNKLPDNDLYEYMKNLNEGTWYDCQPTINAVVCESGNKEVFALDVFNLQTGKRLWVLDSLESRVRFVSVPGALSVANQLEVFGKIFFEVYPKYDCTQYCNATCTTFVCPDNGEASEPVACRKCNRDYATKGELRVYDIKTGQLVWSLAPGSDVGFSFKMNEKTLSPEPVVDSLTANYYEYKNGESVLVGTKQLDLNTGKEIVR